MMVLCAARRSYLQFCFCCVCQPASCFLVVHNRGRVPRGKGGTSPLFVTKKCVGGAPAVPRGPCGVTPRGQAQH